MAERVLGSRRHVVAPGLVRKRREDGVFTLSNPAQGTAIDVEEESAGWVEAILAGFARGTPPDEFMAKCADVPQELLVLMIRSGFVLDESEFEFLEHGFLRPTQAPIGHVCSWYDLPEIAQPGAWVVIGAPVDIAALGVGGARQGPQEIRKAVSGPLLKGEGDVIDHELGRLYPAPQTRVWDLGDVDPEGGRLDHFGQRLSKVAREVLEQRMRPLVLGGDHSVTHFVLLEAIAQTERFGIIHFDAHHDLLPSRTLSHANVFRAALASERVERVLQIGLRAVERMNPYATSAPCAKRRVVSARQAEKGLAMSELEALPRDIPYYVTFDIDCIDASIVRETGTPVFGGLSVELATDLLDYVARTFDLLGVDFVEVAGPQGPTNAAASIAASLLQRCVLGTSAFEVLSTDIYQVPQR